MSALCVKIEELVDLLSTVAVNLENLHIPVASNIVLQDRCELHPQGPYKHHGRPPRRPAAVEGGAGPQVQGDRGRIREQGDYMDLPAKLCPSSRKPTRA